MEHLVHSDKNMILILDLKRPFNYLNSASVHTCRIKIINAPSTLIFQYCQSNPLSVRFLISFCHCPFAWLYFKHGFAALWLYWWDLRNSFSLGDPNRSEARSSSCSVLLKRLPYRNCRLSLVFNFRNKVRSCYRTRN